MPTDSNTFNVPGDMLTLRQAFSIANRAVLEDLDDYAVPATIEWAGIPAKCFDTRPMLDPREHAPEAIDMATEALGFAERSGLIERHPQHRYLVRIASKAA